MRTSRFTPKQLLQELRQAGVEKPVMEIRRKRAVTQTTFYRWKKQYPGLDVSELRELKQLRDENRWLKRAVTELSLDNAIP